MDEGVVNVGLSEADYRLLLSCVEGIQRCRKLEDFPKHVLAELRKLLVCHMACYAELDYARKRAVHEFDPPIGQQQPWFEGMIEGHPVLNYFTESGDGQALKISDFISEKEFHQLPLYREAFSKTKVEDELGFGVRVENRFVLGFAFHRSERSFTERDRMLLNLIRPHVVQAYLHLEELAGCHELQADLQEALRESGVGVIIVDAGRRVVHATPMVWEKLAARMPVPDDGRTLPDALERWAFDETGEDLLKIGVEGAQLVVRRKRQEASRMLLLLGEESAGPGVDPLVRFNLTPREREVLRWIADGKSNSEIGTILGVSVSTAKTHVERILFKLGVENRTGAASVLRGSGVDPGRG